MFEQEVMTTLEGWVNFLKRSRARGNLFSYGQTSGFALYTQRENTHQVVAMIIFLSSTWILRPLA
jgi:hypothetical protein